MSDKYVRVCADCGLGAPTFREGLCRHCYPAYVERLRAAAYRAKNGIAEPRVPDWYEKLQRAKSNGI